MKNNCHNKRYNSDSYKFYPLDDKVFEGYALECPSDEHKFYSLYDVDYDDLRIFCCYHLGCNNQDEEIWDMSIIRNNLIFKLRRNRGVFPYILAIETSDEMADHIMNNDVEFVMSFKEEIKAKYKEIDHQCKLKEDAANA